jgi:hypothetical protein
MVSIHTLWLGNLVAMPVLFLISLFVKNRVIGYLQKILFITFLALSLVVGYYIIFALIIYYMGMGKVLNILGKRYRVIKENWITLMCVAPLLGPMLVFLAFGGYIMAGVFGILLGGVLYLAKNGIIEDAYMMAMEVMAMFAGDTKKE